MTDPPFPPEDPSDPFALPEPHFEDLAGEGRWLEPEDPTGAQPAARPYDADLDDPWADAPPGTVPAQPADPGEALPGEPEPDTVPALPADPDADPAPGTVPARPAHRLRPNPHSRTPVPLGPRFRRPTTGGGSGRFRIIAVIVALLVVGGLVDRVGAAAGGSTSAQASVPPVPTAAPVGSVSSSWFCAGATDNDKGVAPGQLVIANTNPAALTATVQLVGSSGKPATNTVSVPAHQRITVPEDLPGKPAWIGADVTLHGGAAAVDLEVTGSLGTSATPCATAGSRTWFFTDGRTAVNATDQIVLYNPYPVDSLADLSFTTNEGLEAPSQDQALDVPPHGIVTVNLGDHLRRRTAIATTVTTRTGRVVAWQTRNVTEVSAKTPTLSASGTAPAGAIDPASPVAGTTVALGASSAGRTWSWPDGIAGNGVDEQYTVYNPGPDVAQVSLAVNLDQGSASPFTLSIPPTQVATVISTAEARIPTGVTHSAVLRSTNGQPVVAERTVAAGSPSARIGLGVLNGERTASPAWLFPAGSVTDKIDEIIVLYNPGRQDTTAAVATLDGTPVSGLGRVPVKAGARVSIDLSKAQAGLNQPLTVRSGAPLYAEDDLYGLNGQRGYGLGPGVPLR